MTFVGIWGDCTVDHGSCIDNVFLFNWRPTLSSKISSEVKKKRKAHEIPHGKSCFKHIVPSKRSVHLQMDSLSFSFFFSTPLTCGTMGLLYVLMKFIVKGLWFYFMSSYENKNYYVC